MSKARGHKGDARREERRRTQFAELQQRAASAPAPAAPREHIQGIDITGNEEKYEPFLLVIETGLVEFYDEREHLPVDEDAERALRLVIARFEGDRERHSGSADVDAMAGMVMRNIETFFRRHPLLSRAEIVGCLRRVITSIRTWHTPDNPRAYFEFIAETIHEMERAARPPAAPERRQSGLWVPGQDQPTDEEEETPAPRRPGGLWVPGDR